jgi:hypothetical protein
MGCNKLSGLSHKLLSAYKILMQSAQILDRCKYQQLIKLSLRSYLKYRVLVQGQGGLGFQPAGIHWYFEELKPEPNTEIGPKNIFEIASNGSCR